MITPITRLPARSTGLVQDVATQLTALRDLEAHELRKMWQRHYQKAPPQGLSRDMLVRAVAYKIQVHAFGGLSKSTLRRLRTLSDPIDGQHGTPHGPQLSLRSGTKLVRQWGGATHTVLVLDDGFEYGGHRYPSLTRIATLISGLHRSGPAFFGLRRPSASSGEQQRGTKTFGADHG